MVGRRLEGREQLARKAATSAAIDPLAALDELGADERKQKDTRDDLAFPSALAGEPEERARPLGAADTAPAAGSAVTPPPPAPAPAAPAAADEAKKKADDEAQKKKAAAEEAKKAAALAEEQAKANEAKRAAALAADKKAADEAKKAADDAAAKAKTDKPAAADKAASAAAADKKAAKQKGKYTLQLSSFQDRAEAEAFAANVAGAGYKPYIVKSEVPDRGTYFRVRLGEYGSHEDAIAAKADFEAKQHIIAYVTRL
jgi:cell division septation protein DedD